MSKTNGQSWLERVRRKIRLAKLERSGIEKGYEDLETQQVFDRIHEQGAWGKDDSGNATSGAGSHEDSIVDPYVEKVSNLLTKLGCKPVMDWGCGAFNVGKNRYASCENILPATSLK